MHTRNENDRLIRASYGDPTKSTAERATWQEVEVREGSDGREYTATRTAHRWAGSFSYGPWKTA